MIDKDKVIESVDDWYQLAQDMCVDLPDDRKLSMRGIPCPVCGGEDRFSYKPSYEKTKFYCRSCGGMDGLSLIQQVNSWSFSNTVNEVGNHLGLKADAPPSEYRRKMDDKRYWRALLTVYCSRDSRCSLTDNDILDLNDAKEITRQYHAKYGKPTREQVRDIAQGIRRQPLGAKELKWTCWPPPGGGVRR